MNHIGASHPNQDVPQEKRQKKGTLHLKEGDAAPDTELTRNTGGGIRLSGLRGRTIVLSFCPKDETAGCTAEALDFSALLAEFGALGAEVIGVSRDSIANHTRFRSKYHLAMSLASDADTSVARVYGVWVEKTMYGRKYMGVERATFLIDRTGHIAKTWRRVRVAGHAQEVLSMLRTLAEHG